MTALAVFRGQARSWILLASIKSLEAVYHIVSPMAPLSPFDPDPLASSPPSTNSILGSKIIHDCDKAPTPTAQNVREKKRNFSSYSFLQFRLLRKSSWSSVRLRRRPRLNPSTSQARFRQISLAPTT